MVYATVAKTSFSWPAKYGWFLAGWAYLCTWRDRPEAGLREISIEEWNATPPQYLRHPDHHPRFLAKTPGDAAIQNEREQLFKKYAYKDHDPSHPAEGHGHSHH